MLSFLTGGRAEHPLADPRRAAELLHDLPAHPARALEELLALLDSVAAAADLPAGKRAEAIELLDGAGQAHARKLAREFFAARDNRPQAQRLWTIGRDYWLRYADAWTLLVEDHARGARGADGLKRSIPAIAVRAARAWGQLGRWLAFAHGPRDETLWSRLGGIVQVAEAQGFARSRLAPYARVPLETSVESELVRLAAFTVSAPGTLDVHALEILDRLIATFAGDFALLDAHRPGAFYWLDLARGAPPGRYASVLKPRPTLRFLAAGGAQESIDAMIGDLVLHNAVPEHLGLPAELSAEEVLAVLRHLRAQWVAPLPIRRHPRHSVVSHVNVADGFDGIVDVLTSQPVAGTTLDFSQGSPVESWVTENVSLGGMAALAPPGREERIGIGMLVAVQPENTQDWRVGIVRRLERLDDGHLFVALDLLGPTPTAVEVYVESRGEVGRMAEVGILLVHPAPEEGPTQLALRAGVHSPGDAYRLEHQGRRYAIEPRRIRDRGGDYEIVEGTIRPLP